MCKRLCAVFVLALVAGAMITEKATAQVWVAPDRSIVILGRQQPIQIGGFYRIGPVVVGPGRRWVRVPANFSGTIVNPNFGFRQPVFFKPLHANDRARLANFYGAPPQRR